MAVVVDDPARVAQQVLSLTRLLGTLLEEGRSADAGLALAERARWLAKLRAADLATLPAEGREQVGLALREAVTSGEAQRDRLSDLLDETAASLRSLREQRRVALAYGAATPGVDEGEGRLV
ncbi:MAG: hypothetical protein ACYC1C_17620 [Chloroflexota bacterium]